MKIYSLILFLLSTLPLLSMNQPRKRSRAPQSIQALKIPRQGEFSDMCLDQENQNRILHSITCWGAILKGYSQPQNHVQGQ